MGGPITGLAAGPFWWQAMSTGTDTGAYEGMSATLHHLGSTASEPDSSVDGVIYATEITTCDAPTPSEAPTT